MSAADRSSRDRDEPRREYDFSEGERGRYASRYARGSNVVVLAPDVARVFRTSRAVNRALRSRLTGKVASRPRRRRRRAPK
ncbi:MAG TPA: hypothetical protein VFS92_07865 [Planctomycetota bacterium]|nr:hypothetical protein [Planctomycetota bacterium]